MKDVSEKDWLEICDIFHHVVELSQAEREEVLAKIRDEKKRAEVEKLLAADTDESAFLQSSPMNAIASDSLKIPEQIGRYKILREIGRGGMGAVYLAEREDLKKQVALKIIKRGMDTDEILRRFQTERQILANLEHSNIARLLDGGVSEDGLPFIVMEYVAGEDLLAFCNEKELSLNQNLDLFRKICAAVQYAHQNLVVHRDLKPSNIIVTKDGEPKLLDFGISKLLTSETNATGTATSLGMMTPNYASPEQFRGETVSTATDIYSLGVILFELLTGNLPYEIRTKRFEEAARIVAETEPRKPSAVISDSKFQIPNSKSKDGYKFQTEDEKIKDQRLKTKDQNQKTNPKSQILNPKLLRGDLDNIILRALRKEPARRYATVEQFSEDIRRHLDGLPVMARPDTFSYRAEKFIKRNRLAVGSAALVFLLLAIGIGGVSWQYVRAERERILAEKRFGEVRQMANNVVFKYYDEAEKLTGSTKMREMMVTDALTYLDGLANDAAGDATLQRELGLAYSRIGKVQGRAYFANLGDTKSAVESYKKGIGLLEPFVTQSNDVKFQWDFINSLGELSSILRRQGNISESDIYQKRATELGEKFLAVNPDDPTLLTRSAYNYYFIGDTLPLGKSENENIGTFQKCVAAAEKVLSRDPNHLRANNILAAAIQRIGSNLLILARNAEEIGDRQYSEKLTQEAFDYYRKATGLAEKIIKSQPNDALYEGILAAAKFNESEPLTQTKQYTEALRVSLEGLQNYENKLQADPENSENKLNLTYVYVSLNTLYLRLGNAPKADESYRKTIKLFDDIIARDGENMDYRQKRQQSAYLYADELLKIGKPEEARKIYAEEFAAFEQKMQEKSPQFNASIRGFMLEKNADCDFANAKNPNLPKEKQREFYRAALAKYENALEIWKDVGAQIAFGVTDAQRIEIAKRKAEICRTLIKAEVGA
jgi:eukaryotic-like serine/threonine-protein kinase